jgi:hypothetical protein
MKQMIIVFTALFLAVVFQSSLASAQTEKSSSSRASGAKKMTAEKQQEEVPFACNLTALSAAEREHHKELSKKLRAAVEGTRELSDGYGFRLNGERQTIAMVAEWVSLERLCCPFFTFQLEIGSDAKPIWLRMTGREGVKDFMRLEFGLK